MKETKVGLGEGWGVGLGLDLHQIQSMDKIVSVEGTEKEKKTLFLIRQGLSEVRVPGKGLTLQNDEIRVREEKGIILKYKVLSHTVHYFLQCQKHIS